MISETHDYLAEGRSLIEKVFDFEDYLIRRSLGLYYVGWGSAFMLFALSGLFYEDLSSYPWSMPVMYVVASLIVMLFTRYVFIKAPKAPAVLQKVYGKSYTVFDYVLFAIILGVASVAIFYRSYDYLIVFYIALSIYVPWVIFHLIKKSLTSIHAESWIAIVTFAAACVISVAGIEKDTYYVLSLSWILEAVVWLVCGILGIFNAFYQSVVIVDDE